MTWQTAVHELLATAIGLDVVSVGPAAIERAVQTRAAALGLGSAGDYPARLRQSAAERQALIEEVVVPESWFFRDGRPFARLQTHVRAHWLRAAPAPPTLRILSLPCAGGEEAYSIAIALREIGFPPEKTRIDAVDISIRALARARAGIYGPIAFRGPEFCDRDRYFRPHPAGWELNPELRGMVHFQEGNLLDADLLADRPPYHVIFCRNLLIYLTGPARRHAADRLDRLLAEDGLLFVGHAESLSLLEPRFVPDADRASFAYRRFREVGKGRSGKADFASVLPFFSAAEVKSGNPPLDAPAGAGDFEQMVRPSAAALLDQAAELANRREYDGAIQLCEQALYRHGPEPRTFFLMGMIELARGETERAEENLLKAVYLDGDAEEALLALGLICQRRGDDDAASRYRRRAERARRAKEPT